jgi:hypothetical protein
MNTFTIEKWRYTIAPLSDDDRAFVMREFSRAMGDVISMPKGPAGTVVAAVVRKIASNAYAMASISAVLWRYATVHPADEPGAPEVPLTGEHFEPWSAEDIVGWLFMGLTAAFGGIDDGLAWLARHDAKGNA